MKKFLLAACLALIFAFLPALTLAQDETLDLRLNRDFGYGGLNGEIEGRFSMIASGPDSLVEVRFRIDNVVVSTDTEAPFRYQFETGEFDPGVHALSATGILADGRELQSAVVRRTFLSEEEARSKTTGLVGPLLVIVLGFSLVGVLGPILLGRKKEHVPGQYGMAGGAICPRCAMPYSRGVLSPNLVMGKLERCPHCGKWAIVPRASAALLAEADERLAAEAAPEMAGPVDEAEKLRRMIDDSKFDN